MDQYINNKTLRYILYSLAFLPIFILRDFTPDNELRYLSIADEALRNGSVFTFTNHGLIYADKPPLYLWIVMLGKSIFEYHSMAFLSLFSFIPALVTIFVMDKWVSSELSENERLIGQLMLLTAGFFIGTALVLRMDMLMCMFIVLALYTFFRIYSRKGRPRDSILFPVYVFMAIFTKGPIGIIVPLMSIAVFLLLKKEFRTIGRYWGWKTLGILLLLCGAWFAGVYAEGGNQYLNNLLFKQTVNRAVNSFHHQEPFYYYFVSIWYSLAPWSFLIIGILWVGFRNRIISTDLERFFLTVALSTFVTLSLFSSKLAVYLLPTVPFFVYLSLLWMKKLGTRCWMFILTGIPATILCLALPGIFISKLFTGSNDLNTSPVILITALLVSGIGVLTLNYLVKRQLYSGLKTMGAGILLSIFTVSFAVPHFNPIIGLNQLCSQAMDTASKKGGVTYYYCEMSRAENIDVYLGVKPIKVRIKDLYATDVIKKPAILFTWNKAIERNDSIQVFIKDKKVSRTGTFYYVEID